MHACRNEQRFDGPPGCSPLPPCPPRARHPQHTQHGPKLRRSGGVFDDLGLAAALEPCPRRHALRLLGHGARGEVVPGQGIARDVAAAPDRMTEARAGRGPANHAVLSEHGVVRWSVQRTEWRWPGVRP
jgi:hypothetical protein